MYNRTGSKAETLVAKGAKQSSRPADAVASGGIVVTLLWDDAALESIVNSPVFLEQLGPNGIHISMSTVLPETSKKVAYLHEQHGSAYVEAPIFGRPEAAAAKKLWIPMAGAEKAKERVYPILKAMGGQGIFDFGEKAGAAALVKLVGNFLLTSASYSLKEALAVAEKNDVDPKAVVDMLTQTLFPAPPYISIGNRIAQKKEESLSEIPLKDVSLLEKTAKQVELSAPISSLLQELLRIDLKCL